MQEDKQNIEITNESTNESTNNIINTISDDDIIGQGNNKSILFNHLNNKNCTYFEHFKHAMYYSYTSFKASFYFFVHAFLPDFFTESGSITINRLNNTISSHAYNDINSNINFVVCVT